MGKKNLVVIILIIAIIFLLIVAGLLFVGFEPVANKGGNFSVWCMFHSIHTTFSDGRMNSDERDYLLSKNYDCASTIDHDNSLDSIEWKEMINEADTNNKDGLFTYFFGVEWTTNKGHKAYILLNPPDNPFIAGDVSEFSKFLSDYRGLAFYAHPAQSGGSGTDFAEANCCNDSFIPLIEIINKGVYHWSYYWNCSLNSGCLTYENPRKSGLANASSSKWIKYALDNGRHLGFMAATDYHGDAKSFNAFAFTGISRINSLTRESIYEALKNRHTWAAESRIYMDIFVRENGKEHIMGDIFNVSNNIQLNYYISSPKSINELNLFFDGVIINSTKPNSNVFNSSFALSFEDNKEHYVFLEAVQDDGKRAFSSPMYITRI